MKKVLVVDDSALMRKLIMGVLGENGYEVRAARNGAEAVQEVVQWEPDVVTLDINMPELDGLSALSLIMEARPTPVIMVSSLTEKGALATFEALALGAVDFIPKPGGTISLKLDDIQAILLEKVRSATRARVNRRVTPRPAPQLTPRAVPRLTARPTPRPTAQPAGVVRPAQPAAPAPSSATSAGPAGLVVIGVSTGGPRTLEDILPNLPGNFPWPVVVAQHMPANFTDTFARRMDTLCALQVVEVATAMPLTAGTIYIGRGGNDVVICERAGRLHVAPRPESPAVLWHPSVEILVDTAMDHLPANRLVGVMLTGMGNDGAHSMTRLHGKGGRTIAESAESSVVFGMPSELIDLGGASVVLPSSGVARQLQRWIS